MDWYQKEAAEALAALQANYSGLSSREAAARLDVYGPNTLQEKKRKPPLTIFLDQFKDFMILVLLAAAFVSGFIGDVSDTVSIIVIILLNALIGFIQEYRAEKAMEALKRMASPAAVALRDGVAATVGAAELVPGDVVLLEAGVIVPADLRLLETAQLKVEEAALTGESVPADKETAPLPGEHALGDRKNMAYKGTLVTSGRGAGLVVATGMATELGRIASLLQGEEEGKTPLQKRLAVFGKKLAVVVLLICVFVFSLGLLRGEAPLLMLLTAISLAVAAIPEALPAVITISLALGAQKLVRQNALIRKLPAVETLGSVTYICSDKTGTLTLNKMTVEKIYMDRHLAEAAPGGTGLPAAGEELLRSPAAAFFTALALNNDVRLTAGGTELGDPTEVALYQAAKRNGFDKASLEQALPRVAELPFDSERKCMTTFHRWGSGWVAFSKGAVDVLLASAGEMLTARGLEPVAADEVERVNAELAADGLRVLGVAMRFWEQLPPLSPAQVETGLTFLGLAGMMDPPRTEVKEAVALCKTAGIIPVMITGDHPATAKAIASALGILDKEGEGLVTGRELAALSPAQFAAQVEHIRVYARVAPDQKLMIVRALQEKGHFVAMTGDGVNDAPALKRADIGVAMGITGTDVSKEASHMILLDDNFATIVRAVQEGRKIYDNIRKFIKYLLATNSGEIWTLLLAPLCGLPIPLLPIHILWINLVTDGLPALALAAEPAEGDVMKRPPRHPQESIFAHGLGLHAIWVGFLMGVVVLGVQTWALATGHSHWQTMAFTVLCLTQLGHVLAIRSETQSLFRQGLFSNPHLAGAIALTVALQLATIYIPALNLLFKTVPLTWEELLLTVALSSVVFVAVELEKLFKRRGRQGAA